MIFLNNVENLFVNYIACSVPKCRLSFSSNILFLLWGKEQFLNIGFLSPLYFWKMSIVFRSPVKTDGLSVLHCNIEQIRHFDEKKWKLFSLLKTPKTRQSKDTSGFFVAVKGYPITLLDTKARLVSVSTYRYLTLKRDWYWYLIMAL